MMNFRKLVEAGVHFGHKTSRWHPKMQPFIWGYKNNIHLINVAKTAQQMERAGQFLESIAAEGKVILWVGTKKVAQDAIAQVGQKLKSPYVIHRWIGGTLTNYSQVKKSITKLLHFEDILAKTAKLTDEQESIYTKKEIGVLQKARERLQKNVGTIRNFTWPIGAVVLVDVKKEQTALREAKSENVPVVALVDTNCDPSMIDYVIPCNDDAKSSIELIINYLADAVAQGQTAATQRQDDVEASAHKGDEEEPALDAIASTPDNAGDEKKKKDLKPKKRVMPRQTKSSK